MYVYIYIYTQSCTVIRRLWCVPIIGFNIYNPSYNVWRCFRSFWLKCSNSLTWEVWSKAIWGWFPVLTIIPLPSPYQVSRIHPQQWWRLAVGFDHQIQDFLSSNDSLLAALLSGASRQKPCPFPCLHLRWVCLVPTLRNTPILPHPKWWPTNRETKV